MEPSEILKIIEDLKDAKYRAIEKHAQAIRQINDKIEELRIILDNLRVRP